MIRWFLGSRYGHDRHPVDQELCAGNDDLIAHIQARSDGIGVAHRIAQSDPRLDGKGVPSLLARHKNEALATLAGDCQHRDHRHGRGAPDNARLDHLGSAQNLWSGVHGSLDQNLLHIAIYLRRKKIDLRLLDEFATRIHEVDGKPLSYLVGALSRDIDIGFEILAFIYRGQHGWWRVEGRSEIANVHRNVAHDAVKRSADGVVGQLLLLRLAEPDGGLVIRFGVLKGLLLLVEDVLAGDACLKELALPLQFDRVVVVERLLLAFCSARSFDRSQLLVRVDFHHHLPGLDMIAGADADLRKNAAYLRQHGCRAA